MDCNFMLKDVTNWTASGPLAMPMGFALMEQFKPGEEDVLQVYLK